MVLRESLVKRVMKELKVLKEIIKVSLVIREIKETKV